LTEITCTNERCTDSTNLSFALINARSIKNKTTALADYISENCVDVVAITETWLGRDGRDRIIEGQVCPSGYSILHVPRSHGKGGGVAVLYKSSLKVAQVACKVFDSFEHIEVKISPTDRKVFMLAVIYRPPPNTKNGLSTPQFLDEFSNFLDANILGPEDLLICGDFNFHFGKVNDKEASTFTDLLSSYGLQQHVTVSTHTKGHVLDLIITRSSVDSFLKDTTVTDMLISDHFWVHCNILCSRPGNICKKVKYRKIKAINIDSFCEDIKASTLGNPINTDVSTLVNDYNRVLSELLNKHAPLKERNFTIRKDSPWFTDEIAEAKRAKRKAERKWRKTNLIIHRDMFQEATQHVNNLIDHAKKQYYVNKVKEADQKSFFKIVDKLMNKSENGSLPCNSSTKELADRFCQFFTDKIYKIRNDLTTIQSSQVTPTDNPCPSSDSLPHPPVFSNFEPVTEEEVRKMIMSTKTKSCSQDPIPTSLLKDCLSTLLPVITKMVNLSMSQGLVPAELKKALILPLLKKPGLDSEILKHFRPVSNLTYLSKLLERLVAQRLLKHLTANNLQESFQSSYTKFHSTETALLRVQNDILAAIDDKKCILLVLLDLSAAFDTIDHKTLLLRLAARFGIKGTVLEWFTSYLSDRTQAVLIDEFESALHMLLYGVPQGSVLGPILFILYISPLGDLLRQWGMSYHLYADDTQLYISFDVAECHAGMRNMEQCVELVRSWMADNFLKLNEEKTEVLFLGSQHLLSKLQTKQLTIGCEQITPREVVRNIGAYMDSKLSMDYQVGQICKAAWFHLRNIGRIRSYLDNSSTAKLIHAFVSSKLDCNNSLLIGISKEKRGRLQRIQNAAARLVTLTSKYDHITPVLKDLHWLPIAQRIEYKILLLTFKALTGQAPTYLKDLLQLSHQTRSLRSNDQRLLACPRSRTVHYGDRCFSVAAPVLWNKLPQNLRLCDSLSLFKSQLKTYLFNAAYDMK
jgi:exonuclease III